MKGFARQVLLPAAVLVAVAVIAGLLQNSVTARPLRLLTPSLPPIGAVDEPKDVQRAVHAGAVLMDSRAADQFATAHLEGALSVPFPERDAHLDGLIRRVPSTIPVIVYCDEGCGSAPRLAEWLRAHGWRRVSVFRGGIRVWQQAGLPVTYGPAP